MLFIGQPVAAAAQLSS